MNRRQRTEILVGLKAEVLKDLVARIESDHKVQMIEPAKDGLVMVKMRDTAKKQVFFLGEVLVTECKVMIQEAIGLGIIQGTHPKKAYYLALVDAAYGAKLPVCSQLDGVLLKHEQQQHENKKMDAGRILKTKVTFETLDEEVKA